MQEYINAHTTLMMNSDSTKQNTIRQLIMQRIANGGTRMRPAWHFGLVTALWALGILLVLLTTMLLISFVVFAMRQTGVMSAPAFGLRGVLPFVAAIPWLLVVLCALFVLGLEMLTRHFAFAYRRPLLVSLAVIIGIAFVGGSLFARTPFHPRLFDRAAQGRLPIAGPLYQRYGFGIDSTIYPGVISSLQGDIIMLSNRRGMSIAVRITDTTDIGEGILAIGRPVIVLGEKEGTTITALSIIPAPDDMLWSIPASGGMPMRMHRYPLGR